MTTSNDGSDTYGLEIRLPFIAQTRQTLQEKAEGKPAETVDRMVSGLKDKDDRKKGPAHHNEYEQYGQQDDSGFTPF